LIRNSGRRTRGQEDGGREEGRWERRKGEWAGRRKRGPEGARARRRKNDEWEGGREGGRRKFGVKRKGEKGKKREKKEPSSFKAAKIQSGNSEAKKFKISFSCLLFRSNFVRGIKKKENP
jgi:hypothetical protein